MAMRVEVVFALPGRSWCWPVQLPEGGTVADALAGAPLAEAGLSLAHLPAGVGIYGREVALTATLHDHDRVEIYRPLLHDPREERRQRVERERAAAKPRR